MKRKLEVEEENNEPPNKRRKKLDGDDIDDKSISIQEKKGCFFSLKKYPFDKETTLEFFGKVLIKVNGRYVGGYKGRFDEDTILTIEQCTHFDDFFEFDNGVLEEYYLCDLGYEEFEDSASFNVKEAMQPTLQEFLKEESKKPEDMREYTCHYDHHYMGTTFYEAIQTIDVYVYVKRETYEKYVKMEEDYEKE